MRPYKTNCLIKLFQWNLPQIQKSSCLIFILKNPWQIDTTDLNNSLPIIVDTRYHIKHIDELNLCDEFCPRYKYIVTLLQPKIPLQTRFTYFYPFLVILKTIYSIYLKIYHEWLIMKKMWGQLRTYIPQVINLATEL